VHVRNSGIAGKEKSEYSISGGGKEGKERRVVGHYPSHKKGTLTEKKEKGAICSAIRKKDSKKEYRIRSSSRGKGGKGLELKKKERTPTRTVDNKKRGVVDTPGIEAQHLRKGERGAHKCLCCALGEKRIVRFLS